MRTGDNINALEELWRRNRKTMLATAAVTAVNHFKRSFEIGGWAGESFERWPGRKPGAPRPSRALLVDTGRLRRSIRVTARGASFITVGTDVPYGRAHNLGLTYAKRVQVAAHSRKTKRGAVAVKSHSRQMNTTMPQRQFLGSSPGLNKAIGREWARRFR